MLPEMISRFAPHPIDQNCRIYPVGTLRPLERGIARGTLQAKKIRDRQILGGTRPTRHRPKHSIGRATQGLRGKLHRERLDTFHKLLRGIILHGGIGRPWGSGATARIARREQHGTATIL